MLAALLWARVAGPIRSHGGALQRTEPLRGPERLAVQQLRHVRRRLTPSETRRRGVKKNMFEVEGKIFICKDF
ncbi:hypothetical protein EYF80_058406 [Liparis tanakae]|uniref:Uncharacterized protein n=1 Tax=Liparis tanakae TaxID=230148 RepID=A0A4Z2ET22_9TELE|nr:hypothetical protein EYF80_058406 [Liparis tanakae]